MIEFIQKKKSKEVKRSSNIFLIELEAEYENCQSSSASDRW